MQGRFDPPDHPISGAGATARSMTPESRPGAGGGRRRHPSTGRLPGPIGLAALVAVLLVTFGAGAALLQPNLAGGRSGLPDAPAGLADGPGAPAGDPAAAPPAAEPPAPAAKATPTAVPTKPPVKATKPARGGTRTPAKPAKPAKPLPVPRTVPAMEDQVTTLINQERAKAGCGRVRTDERLRRAARGHSQDMAARNYFDHDSLDGRSPWDRAKAQGYMRPIGENIAKGQRTPADVVRAWMNSPGHRSNILNCSAKATGVGLALDGNTKIWTQMFGSQ